MAKAKQNANLKDTQDYCNALKLENSAKNHMQDEMENLYLMIWEDKARIEREKKNFKVTISPDARNKLLGAVRLLISTDPHFSVPYEKNDAAAEGVSEKLEKAARILWQAAGRMSGTPIHYDSILSGLLWGEAHYGITSTQDLVAHAAKGSPALRKRAEAAAQRAPYLIDVWDPRDGYAAVDNLGLRAYYRESEMTVDEVVQRYGKPAEEILSGMKRLEKVTLNMFYDLEYSVVWVNEKQGKAIVNEAHELPFIPIVASVGEGSQLFSKPEYQVQPFLYGVWKSGLANRQNMALSVLFHLVFSLGVNPQLVFKANQPDKELNVNYDVAGGVVTIENNEEVHQLPFNALDPNVMSALGVADQKSEESTIFSQTLGQPLEGSHVSFSMISLLAQAGRLPLVWPQRKLSWGIGDVMEIMLKWLKHDKRAARAKYGRDRIELEPDEIPDDFEVDVKLDVNLPQDKLQTATIVDMITRGPNPVVSKRFGREEYLGISNPDEIQAEIWTEMAADAMVQAFMQEELAAAQGGGMPGGMGMEPSGEMLGQEMSEEIDIGPGGEPDIRQIVEAVRSGQLDMGALPAPIQEVVAQILEMQGGGGPENAAPVDQNGGLT